jgi:uncharacterized protein
MTPLGEPAVGRFCWLDLAASDATEAKAFYRQWRHLHAPVLARSRCRSLYQMETKLARKVSSHCTPYVRVEDVQLAAQRAREFGGRVLVRPFVVAGVARIALIMDSVGAQVGLWEPIDSMESERHG